MASGDGTLTPARLARLGLIGASVAVPTVAGYFALEQTSKVTRLKGALAFLIGLEFTYGAALAICMAGAPALAGALIWGRRRGVRRTWAARGLLLCVSVLVGLMTCEASALAVRAWRGRPRPVSAVPRVRSSAASRAALVRRASGSAASEAAQIGRAHV